MKTGSKESRKIIHDYVYHGALIPVVISKVSLIPYHDDWIPEIDDMEVLRLTAKAVATKDSRLTGNEVRFLRQWIMLNMADFASAFGYTAPAIHKWEKRAEKPAGMMWSAETQLRLLVLDKLGVSPAAFRKAFRALQQPLPEAPEAPVLIPGDKVALTRDGGKTAKSAYHTKGTGQSKRAA